MAAWMALFGDERTTEELAAVRAKIAKRFPEAFEGGPLTCDNCAADKTCPYVYDPYNTDGDCLAEK
jgi:hypothetical protein